METNIITTSLFIMSFQEIVLYKMQIVIISKDLKMSKLTIVLFENVNIC